MSGTASVTIESGIAEGPAKPKRRRHSIAEKRQIVEESFEPHTSVARVARAHGINANQVFTWRRQYHRGQLGNWVTHGAIRRVASREDLGCAVCSHSNADKVGNKWVSLQYQCQVRRYAPDWATFLAVTIVSPCDNGAATGGTAVDATGTLYVTVRARPDVLMAV